jgi:uncharacterized protein (DUF1800 family)
MNPPLEVMVYVKLAFGPRPGDLEAFGLLKGNNGDKLRTWLETQLDPDKLDDADLQNRLEGLKTLNKSQADLWAQHWRDVPDSPTKYEIAYEPTNELRIATMARAIWSNKQLLEVISDFWHNHFSIDPARDGTIGALLVDFDRMLRKHAFGNFRAMLTAVAKHPAMLYYLDNTSNQRAGPNENWARELFELHTLGSENYLGVKRQRDVPGFAQGQPVGYVDDDVYEATRCFTGWRVDDNKDHPSFKNSGAFAFFPAWHDRFQKTVLGRYLPPDQGPMKDGIDVIEALAMHPGTARHISRKLCRRLVSDDPPDALVARVSSVFIEKRNDPDQIKHVIRAIVYSGEFQSIWGQKIKRPFERFISACRALETEFKLHPDRQWTLDWLGQMPFNHPMPDGYPDRKEHWTSSTSLLRSWQTLNGLAHNWDESYKSPVLPTNADKKVPNEIAAFWFKRLLGREPSQNLKAAVIDKLRDGGNPDTAMPDGALEWRLTEAVGLILMSPEFLER